MAQWMSQWAPTARFTPLDGGNLPVVLSHFQQSTPVTVTNTITETTIFTTGVGTRTFGANWFKPGSIVKINILGTAQTVDAAQTVRIRAYLGATTILDTTALTSPNLASPTAYRREIDFSFSTVGATGSCSAGSTQIIYGTTPASFASSTLPTSSSVNTTIAEQLNITYTWGAASASNILTIYGITVECFG